MSTLNDKAAKIAVEFGLRAATDVTGFSLLGHGYEVTEASHVGMTLHLRSIPFFKNAYKYAKEGYFPGGSANNRLYYQKHVEFDHSIDEYAQMMLFDAQTSGGLLLMLSDEKWESFSARAVELNLTVWPIGKVVEGNAIQVVDSSFRYSGPDVQKFGEVWFFPDS
jgi:selenide,water dikinase